MQTRKRPFGMAALAAGAVPAPAVSVLTALVAMQISPLWGHPGLRPGEADLIPLAIIFATVWGAPFALIFGAAGAHVAERFLGPRPFWAWGLAGLATAGSYMLFSVGLTVVAPNVAGLIAPWLGVVRYRVEDGGSIFDVGPVEMVIAIGVSGYFAGLLYRVALGRRAFDQLGLTGPLSVPSGSIHEEG